MQHDKSDKTRYYYRVYSHSFGYCFNSYCYCTTAKVFTIMNDKVRRVLALLAIAAALFTISEIYTASWMLWVRGAAAGMALAGIVGVVLIIADELKGKSN